MNAPKKQPKPKKCKCGCGETFIPRSSTQVAASIKCAEKIAAKKREQQERKVKSKIRKDTRAALNGLKTHSDYVKDLDTVFAAYIRFRDRDKPCICCGKALSIGSVGGFYDAGHFISRRHLATRWDEANVHAQNKYCNRYMAGNYAGFRAGLIERIGLTEVERLEAARNEVRHFTTQEIKDMIEVFKVKLRELKKFSQ